ncbi:triphosphoribosyl-dephospho-CoA synthase [Scopulibacillus cellulosilyticus]|uniref:triphosphoribosyl-dephospho-CoA synthase n=1 Tax=Scopulibacillus cellulosilyticus TaxID=2665665 RepID=A0ABW2Q0Y2_9BACL
MNAQTYEIWKEEAAYGEYIAQLAVMSLVDEADLTPKPGLVDRNSSGSHSDMTIETMHRSAYALKDTFVKMAEVSFYQKPSQQLREQLAEIGRYGEQDMFKATGGVNTHKGAIWSLGLLASAAAINGPNVTAWQITQTAGAIARYPDRKSPKQATNGKKVRHRYGVPGAVGEAQQGFPHIMIYALPALKKAREKGASERHAKLDALLSLMASLDDTCILHRGGKEALSITKAGARAVLKAGGSLTPAGMKALSFLDEKLVSINASPGGSADLLAAAIFLDRLSNLSAFR